MELWKDSILNSLIERDRREKSQIDLISAYTRLASRTASLEAKVLSISSSSPSPHLNLGTLALQDQHQHTASSPSRSPRPTSSSADPIPTTTTTTGSAILDTPQPPHQQLRTDLLEAQRTKAALTQTLTTLQTSHTNLLAKHASCTTQITKLTTERDLARKRLDTREEEMRFKNKQVERLQDEVMEYEIQLNVLHQQKDALQAEYDGLVARMMRYKEREAEELINNSKYS
ncbi:autophagy-related protein 16 [Peziza echinospora]|nr:autophagy-related protein 16 [Peziza echinospora]